MKYSAIIVAGGKGRRAGLGYNKVFYEVEEGITVLDLSTKIFLEDEDCSEVIVVTSEEDFDKVKAHEKLILAEGGKERMDSVRNGLDKAGCEYVMIHDGARPYLSKRSLDKCKEALEKGAFLLARPSIDTVKEVKDGKVVRTLDRKNIWLAETPQGARREVLLKAYENTKEGLFTDDASVLEAYGVDVQVVEDEEKNPKLTNAEDFRGRR